MLYIDLAIDLAAREKSSLVQIGLQQRGKREQKLLILRDGISTQQP